MHDLEVKKNQAFNEIKALCGFTPKMASDIEDYVVLLLTQNHNFNLIGKSTIPNIWERHILDSAQILRFIDDKNAKIADLGTGAGFPGIIISILGAKQVHLIEKSLRKCEFLHKAKIISPNRIFVHHAKLEEITDRKFDVLTSRALASLEKLLDYCLNFLNNGGYGLFLKGKNLDNEIEEAKEKFDFEYELFDSVTSPESRIIKVRNINKK